MSYPVSFDVERPPRFQRAHVFLRVALLIVIGWIGHPFGLVWLGVPVVATILVAQKGGQRYLDEDGPMLDLLKGFHEVPLHVPTRAADQPDPKRLEPRFSQFLELST